jgi:hypothetical protein
MAYSGRCLCGSIQFESRGEPVAQFNCHCRACQRTSGSAFSPVMFFRRDDLTVRGDLHWYESPGGSGQAIRRGFCPTCGAQVAGDVAVAPQWLSVRAGLLDDPADFRPAAEAFAPDAVPWVCLPTDRPHVDRLPPPPRRPRAGD